MHGSTASLDRLVTRRRLVLKLATFVLLVLGTWLVAETVGLPSVGQLRATFAPMGWWSGVLFAGVYAAVTLAPVPKALFTLTAGALFGVAEGLVTVVTGAMLGAVVAFYLGRALGRDGVRRLTRVRLDRFDHMVARRGFAAVLVARLVPVVPFTALNYLAGLTALRVRDYLGATMIGILPATTAYVVIGADGARPGSWPLWAGIGVLALVTVGAALRGRRIT